MVIYGSLGLDKLSQESCCSVYWTACQTKTLSLLTLLLYNIKFFSKILSNLCFYSVFHFVDITHYTLLYTLISMHLAGTSGSREA